PVTHMIRITTPAMLPAVRWHQKRILRRFMWTPGICLGFRPATKQVVVDASEANAYRRVGTRLIDLLDCGVEIEQQSTFAVFANHALDSEKRGYARSAGDGLDVMQAGGGIKHHMSRRQFDTVNAVGVFDDELAAVVFFGLREEQRRRNIG